MKKLKVVCWDWNSKQLFPSCIILNMSNGGINSGDRTAAVLLQRSGMPPRLTPCFPHHMTWGRWSVWGRRCSCVVVLNHVYVFFRPLFTPFFSLCLSWLYDLCASMRVNRLLQRHVRSCNCACKSQHGSWAGRPPTDTCRLEMLLFDWLLYAPLDYIKYDPPCPALISHLFSFWMLHAFWSTS